jgi:hypothetical protein
MAGTAIILCLLLRGPAFQSNFEILYPWLLDVLENASCDKARPVHLLIAQSFLPSAWEVSAYGLSDLIPSSSGTSDLAFESRPRGIAWRFLGQCREKKEEQSPVHGRHPAQSIYEARKPRYLRFCCQAPCLETLLLSLLCSS